MNPNQNPPTEPVPNNDPVNQPPSNPPQPPESSQPAPQIFTMDSPQSLTPAEPLSSVMPPAIVVQPTESLGTQTALTPDQPTQPYVSQPYAPQSAAGGVSSKFGKNKNKKLLLIGLPLLVVLLIAGGVFGLYLPNTPDHVWQTGINRTGKALDGIVSSATEAKQLELYKTSVITGDAVVHSGKVSYSGNLNTQFDQTTSNSALNVTLNDGTSPAKQLGAKVLTEVPSGATYPNVYFKLTGLSTLGLDQLLDLSSVQDKWIVVSSDYLKSLGSSVLSSDNQQKQPTATDIAELAQTASGVTREYVFTTAKDKAVFEKKSFVGKETIDGVKTWHFKVDINTTHTVAYCVAISKAELSTKAYKKFSGNTDAEITKQKQSAADNCKKSITDNAQSDKDYQDMWIGGKYKLIYKVRVHDSKDKTNYVELGQRYKGGDDLTLFGDYVDTKGKSRADVILNTNLKTSVTKATVTIRNSGVDAYDAKVNLLAKPGSGKVTITKPSGAIPLDQLLQQIGLGSLVGSSSASSDINVRANDSEQQTDIESLMTHLEASYASNGYYPTLAQLNSSAWRSTNMPELDSSALMPPGSNSTALSTTASSTSFGYQPTGCSATGCTGYALDALLSDGTHYSKTNLN